MILPVLNNPADVAAHQLCCGCGACASASPRRIEMIDTPDGRRPRYVDDTAPGARHDDGLAVCPGIGLTHDYHRAHPGLIGALLPDWGPVLEVWEGAAVDPEVRHRASSGGAASAIAIAAIESGDMHGVLHIRARRDAPLLNETVLSTSRAEIVAATGSRYAPASPCDRLDLVTNAPGPCVFIGKPCDVAAVRKSERVRPALRGRIGVTIAMFCAGTPTTQATLDVLSMLGIDDPRDVVDIRYRGNGWPGDMVVTVQTPDGPVQRTLSYEASWGALAKSKQWRCHVCADHTGEFADIAVGDPWHRPISDGEPGRSLVLVRTERGRRVIRKAMAAGALDLVRADPGVVAAAQPSLLRARGATWGRAVACRLLGAPAPTYRGFGIFRTWWTALSLGDKARSIAGTLRRVKARNLRRRRPVDPVDLTAARQRSVRHAA